MLLIAPSFLWRNYADINTIKATLDNVNIHHRRYWENEVKCHELIERFFSARFDDFPECNLKCRVKFITIPLDDIFIFSN